MTWQWRTDTGKRIYRLVQFAFFLVVGASMTSLGLAQEIAVADVGFAHPTSVIHDIEADVYLVSNFGASTFARGGKGFISRMSPNGDMIDLRWIDEARDGGALDSPSAMAIWQDTLYVVDMDRVRLFDRASGASEGSIHLGEATLLIGAAISPEGHLFVSNIALDDAEANAIFRVRSDGRIDTVASGPELKNPTGLVALGGDEFLAVTNSSPALLLWIRNGEVQVERTFPVDNLEGLVQLPGGDLIVSRWGPAPILRFSPSITDLIPLVEGSFAVGNIGYDSTRNRLLAPKYRDDAVLLIDLDR